MVFWFLAAGVVALGAKLLADDIKTEGKAEEEEKKQKSLKLREKFDATSYFLTAATFNSTSEVIGKPNSVVEERKQAEHIQKLISSETKKKIYRLVPLEKMSRSIRLLTLDPPKLTDGGIVCQLKPAALDLPYQALSYAWGDKTKTRDITVNGRSFEVTMELESALRHLRLTKEPITLWIDAICINQADDDEKTLQLPLMRDIYGNAERTIIWLGVGTTDSNMAFAHFGNLGMGDVSVPALLRDYSMNKLPWKCLSRDVVLRPWFSRMWIVQEVIMSRNPVAVCGTRALPWPIIPMMMKVARDHNFETFDHRRASDYDPEIFYQPSLLPRYRRSTLYLEGCRYESQQGRMFTLSSLLTMFSHHDCFHSRDRVIALLGLCEERHEPEIRALYNEKSEVTVYTNCTGYFISKLGDLDFLCGGREAGRNGKLPSWVPDFAHMSPNSHSSLTRPFLPPGQGFRAGGSLLRPGGMPSKNDGWYFNLASVHDAVFVPNRYLSVKAVFEDTIADIGPMFELIERIAGRIVAGGQSQVMRQHQTWIGDATRRALGGSGFPRASQFYAKQHEGHIPENYFTALSRTFVCDRNQVGKRCTNGEGYFHDNETVRKDFMSGKPQELRESSRQLSNALMMIGRLCGKRFMVSEKGLIGLVPKDAHVGDEIHVLYGCSVPVILRKAQGLNALGGLLSSPFGSGLGGNRYEFVGECYVHGIMDGEVINDAEEGVKEARRICLI